LSPGDGSLLIGRGKVKKAGKNLTICVVDVFVVKGGVEKLCATVQMTVMTMHEMMDKPVDTKA
jgi:acyl-coenzyme A thioesterase PaaI-like protein